MYRTIIRAAIHDASDEVCEWILWERTPYPMGAIDVRSLYKAAARVQRAANGKKRLCEFCDRLAEPEKWICHRCSLATQQFAYDSLTPITEWVGAKEYR